MDVPFRHPGQFRHVAPDEVAARIEAALVDVAGVSPDHCWVKFSDSKRGDFIIGEAEEKD